MPRSISRSGHTRVVLGQSPPPMTMPGTLNSISENGQTIRIVGLYDKMNASPAYPFRVSGISADVIDQYRYLSDQELQKQRVVRLIADDKPGFPCRVSLVDAEIGESVLLLNFEHLSGLSPYRSVGPIFVRESATETYSKTNEIPE